MNKDQLKWIEYRLTTLYRSSDRTEDRMEKAKADGDNEWHNKLILRDERLLAQIKGIQETLNCLGYYCRWDDEQNKVLVLKH